MFTVSARVGNTKVNAVVRRPSAGTAGPLDLSVGGQFVVRTPIECASLGIRDVGSVTVRPIAFGFFGERGAGSRVCG